MRENKKDKYLPIVVFLIFFTGVFVGGVFVAIAHNEKLVGTGIQVCNQYGAVFEKWITENGRFIFICAETEVVKKDDEHFIIIKRG